jgi:hypothetical protein
MTGGGGPADGWNLIGNPFAAPLNFRKLYLANSSSIGASLYRFISSTQYTGTYATYNAVSGIGSPANSDSIIAHSQGFMIKAINSASLSVTRAMTSNKTAYTFFKESNETTLPIVRLGIFDQDQYLDECVAISHSGASIGENDIYDSEKFFSMEKRPEIYLTDLNATERKTVINAVPEFKNETVIPIGLTNPGVFRLKVNELSNFPTDVNVYLEDARIKSFTKLADQDFLTITKSGNEPNEGRYFLRFGKIDGASSASESNRPGFAYMDNNVINIRLFNAGWNPSSVEVLDIAGKLIADRRLADNNGINPLNGLVLAPGIYIIKVNTDRGFFNDRVLVE